MNPEDCSQPCKQGLPPKHFTIYIYTYTLAHTKHSPSKYNTSFFVHTPLHARITYDIINTEYIPTCHLLFLPPPPPPLQQSLLLQTSLYLVAPRGWSTMNVAVPAPHPAPIILTPIARVCAWLDATALMGWWRMATSV